MKQVSTLRAIIVLLTLPFVVSAAAEAPATYAGKMQLELIGRYEPGVPLTGFSAGNFNVTGCVGECDLTEINAVMWGTWNDAPAAKTYGCGGLIGREGNSLSDTLGGGGITCRGIGPGLGPSTFDLGFTAGLRVAALESGVYATGGTEGGAFLICEGEHTFLDYELIAGFTEGKFTLDCTFENAVPEVN